MDFFTAFLESHFFWALVATLLLSIALLAALRCFSTAYLDANSMEFGRAAAAGAIWIVAAGAWKSLDYGHIPFFPDLQTYHYFGIAVVDGVALWLHWHYWE